MDPVNGESRHPVVSIKVKCVHTSMCVFVFVRQAGSPLAWEHTLYTCVLTGRDIYASGMIYVMVQLINLSFYVCIMYGVYTNTIDVYNTVCVETTQTE